MKVPPATRCERIAEIATPPCRFRANSTVRPPLRIARLPVE